MTDIKICDVSTIKLFEKVFEPTQSTFEHLFATKEFTTIQSIDYKSTITFESLNPTKDLKVLQSLQLQSTATIFTTEPPKLEDPTEEIWLKIHVNKLKLKFLDSQYTLLNKYFNTTLNNISTRQDFLNTIDLDGYAYEDPKDNPVLDLLNDPELPTIKFYIDRLREKDASAASKTV
jgi:hypothetical protein